MDLHKLKEQLSCSFTWNDGIRLYDNHELNELVDRLPLSVTTWHRTIQLCFIAVSYHVKRNFKKSKSFLTQCYIPLLEIPGIQTDCPLTIKHREALKHVIDSTSTFMQLSSCDSLKARQDVFDNAKTITSHDSMDKTQRAALHAIHSQFADYPDNVMFAREAVKLNPEEGQWHYYLAEALFKADKDGEFMGRARDKALNEVIEHNSLSLQLRRDAPEPFLLMAELLVAGGDSDSSEKSYCLVQNALKKFPNNAHVHVRAADILQTSQSAFCFLPKSFFLIEPLYQKAIKLAEKECACIRHKLGIHQVLKGQFRIENFEEIHDEGIRNLEIAARSISKAKAHLNLAKHDNLTSCVVGIPHLPMPIVCQEAESSEDDDCGDFVFYGSGAAGDVSKKKKKKRKGKGKRK